MFLAELAYNTVQQEIKELEERQQRRHQSLLDSQKELENDNQDLYKFISNDKQLKEQREEAEKRLQLEKNAKDDEIKKLDQRIAHVKSNIEKHKDTLNNLQSNQEFLLELIPEHKLKRQQERHKKYMEVKREWIRRHKADPYLDFEVVFRDDEEIHEGERM